MMKFITKPFKTLPLIFQNFGHWTLSKGIISVSAILLGVLFALPFIILFGITAWSGSLEWFLLWDQFRSGVGDLSMQENLNENVGNFIIGVFFLALVVIMFFIGILYSKVLLFRLNFHYLDGKKLSYRKNIYFHFSFIKTYLQAVGIFIGYLLLPVIGLVLYLFLLGTLVGGPDAIDILVRTGFWNYFNVLSLLGLIVASITFIYIFLRGYGTFLFLADAKKIEKDENGKTYINKSFQSTKKIKKTLHFGIFLAVIVGILVLPVNTINKYMEHSENNISNYYRFSNSSEDIQTQFLDSSYGYYYQALQLEFRDVTKDELISKLKKIYILSIVLNIFVFLFIYGLLEMLITGFYRKELLKK